MSAVKLYLIAQNHEDYDFFQIPSIQPTASLEILELYQEMGCSYSGLSSVVCLTKPFDVLRNTPRDTLCN
jgi:hypothetical protein